MAGLMEDLLATLGLLEPEPQGPQMQDGIEVVPPGGQVGPQGGPPPMGGQPGLGQHMGQMGLDPQKMQMLMQMLQQQGGQGNPMMGGSPQGVPFGGQQMPPQAQGVPPMMPGMGRRF